MPHDGNRNTHTHTHKTYVHMPFLQSQTHISCAWARLAACGCGAEPGKICGCMCVCMYVCMHACMCMNVYVYAQCRSGEICVCMYIRMYVYAYAQCRTWENMWMYVCMYVCMYACVCTDMHIYAHVSDMHNAPPRANLMQKPAKSVIYACIRIDIRNIYTTNMYICAFSTYATA